MLYMVKGSTEHMAADHPLGYFLATSKLFVPNMATPRCLSSSRQMRQLAWLSVSVKGSSFGIALLLQGPAKTNITFEFESAT